MTTKIIEYVRDDVSEFYFWVKEDVIRACFWLLIGLCAGLILNSVLY